MVLFFKILIDKINFGSLSIFQSHAHARTHTQNTVDKLVQRANASLLIGTSSWKEQFIDALTVSAGMCTVDRPPPPPHRIQISKRSNQHMNAKANLPIQNHIARGRGYGRFDLVWFRLFLTFNIGLA